MLLIGYLSVRARKLKEKPKSRLLFVYPAGPGSLKERQKFVFWLFIQQGQKLKGKAKSGLLFVYQAGPGS